MPNISTTIKSTITALTVGTSIATVVLLSALTLLSPSTAHAQTITSIISDLNQTNSGLANFNTTSDRLAQSFTTNNATYTNLFLYARLNLALQSSSASSDTLHLFLYNNGAGTVINGAQFNASQPTTQFADLGTVNVGSTTVGTYTFSSSSRFSLSASTQYWIVLQDDANSNAGWNYTTSTSYTGPGTVNANAATGSSADAGNSWVINRLTYTDPGAGTVNYGEQLFEFGTSSAALPEPDALPLLACGLFGFTLLLVARHRNRILFPISSVQSAE